MVIINNMSIGTIAYTIKIYHNSLYRYFRYATPEKERAFIFYNYSLHPYFRAALFLGCWMYYFTAR